MQSEINVHDGELFGESKPTGRRLALSDVELLAPAEPSKIIALWNNFHALAAKLNVREPDEPLYLLKAPTTTAAPNAVVRRPVSYDGKVTYEGELGIVIGRTCSEVPVDRADQFIFGYTCVNDITANDIIGKDASFAQWARAKGYDGFCPFGPVITSAIDPAKLVVRTILNGRRAPELSDFRYDLQLPATRQQYLARHDAAARGLDLLRHLDRGRRDERAGQHGHRHNRWYWRTAQRVSSVTPCEIAALQIAPCSPRFPHGTGVDISRA